MNRVKQIVLRSIVILTVFILGFLGSVTFYIGSLVYRDSRAESDAIIVLGAASYRGADLNPCLVARVSHAVELNQKGVASTIILSGGFDRYTGVNESQTMRAIAIESGIADHDLLLEARSTSTYENLLYSKNIMDKYNIKNATLVSEPFHLPRASFIADKLGIPHGVSPATDSPCWTRWKFLSRYFLREVLAVVYYKLSGKI